MVWVAEVTLLLVLLCLVHQSTLHRLVLVAPFRPTLFLLLSVREAGLRAVRSDCFSFCSSAWFIFKLLSLHIVGFFVGRFAVLVCGGVLSGWGEGGVQRGALVRAGRGANGLAGRNSFEGGLIAESL